MHTICWKSKIYDILSLQWRKYVTQVTCFPGKRGSDRSGPVISGDGSVIVTAKVCRETAAVCSGFFCFWHISCISISVKTLQNRRHGILETKDYSGYSIFEGISGDNLKTITDCVTRGEKGFAPGEVIFSGEKDMRTCMMLLEGKAEVITSHGKRLELTEGMIWGKGFSEDDGDGGIREVRAMTGCRILEMDPIMMYEPCWFSCFFHALFIDNLERVKKAQSEMTGRS